MYLKLELIYSFDFKPHIIVYGIPYNITIIHSCIINHKKCLNRHKCQCSHYTVVSRGGLSMRLSPKGKLADKRLCSKLYSFKKDSSSSSSKISSSISRLLLVHGMCFRPRVLRYNHSIRKAIAHYKP